MKTYVCIAICLACSISSLESRSQNITTIAGSGVSGYSGNGGSATLAQLFHPKGTATDDSGNVYIADADNNVIRKVDTFGVITTIAGYVAGGFSGDGGPAIYAGFNRPNSLARDHAGNMWVSDADNQRIRKINAAGIITTVVGDGTAGFMGDGGPATAAEINFSGSIALDRFGNLYIADEYNNRIRKVDVSGIITTIAGNGSTGYSGEGGSADTAAIGFPFGIAADTSGNVYFSLTLDNRVCKVNTTTHIISTVAGIGGSGAFSGDGGAAAAAEMDNPWGVAVDIPGNLYICDNANERVRMVNTSGIISTIAGTSSAGFSGDGGPATAAKLKQPAGVQVDAMGNVFIADYNNHRVRKILAPPVIPTQISEFQTRLSAIKAWPNPSQGNFKIMVSSGADEVIKVVIEDVVGRKVKEISAITNTPLQIEMNGAGLYFVTAIAQDARVTSSINIVR